MMRYLVKIADGKSEIIKPELFDKEVTLQEIVKKHPEIIPLEEIDESYDQLLIIGREFNVEKAGSIDLLAIDTTGLLTIIEFKLDKNTDIRKVIAQTIEYAANIWEMSYDVLDKKVQEYFNSNRCDIKELKSKTLVQAVRWHYKKEKKEDDSEFSAEEFIKNVSSNLQKGEFRLIIFCDKVDERTKRAVEYLNLLSRFDIYCASTDEYEDGGKKYFKSTLVTADRTKISKEKKYAGKITFDDFLKTIPNELIETFNHLDGKMKETNGYYVMGTKGFAVYFQVGNEKMRPFAAYPNKIELISENLIEQDINKKTIVIPEDAKEDYEENMSKLNPFQDSFKHPGKYPTYKYSQLKPNELKDYFNFIFEWNKRWFTEG